MEGIYAKFETSKGIVLLELTFDKTPGTVGNFVSLAEGTLKNDHKGAGEPYYNGMKFHRVIADFMIQGVDVRRVLVWVVLDINLMMNFIQI